MNFLYDFYDKINLTKTKEICIVSNNCWGYQFYKNLSREYNTPFVGVFLFPDDYLRLLSDFPKSMENVAIIDEFHTMNYPIIKVGNNISVHCLHYSSNEDALEKWNRRAERLLNFISLNSLDSVLFKMCDRDGCTEKQHDYFISLQLRNKIFLSASKRNKSCTITVPGYLTEKGECVKDGKKIFEHRYEYMNFSKVIKENII